MCVWTCSACIHSWTTKACFVNKKVPSSLALVQGYLASFCLLQVWDPGSKCTHVSTLYSTYHWFTVQLYCLDCGRWEERMLGWRPSSKAKLCDHHQVQPTNLRVPFWRGQPSCKRDNFIAVAMQYKYCLASWLEFLTLAYKTSRRETNLEKDWFWKPSCNS